MYIFFIRITIRTILTILYYTLTPTNAHNSKTCLPTLAFRTF